ncbi:hypothetical protein ACFLY9_00820 [Patescibacteria group bacterium]
MDKLNNFIDNLKQVDLTDIDWTSITNWSYLTDRKPSEVFIYEQWIYVIVLLNLVFSAICFSFVARTFIKQKPKYRFVRKISFLWLSNTIFLLLYNLLRSEGVYFLSMRLFLVIILCFFLFIIIYTVIYWIVKIPKKMDKFENAKLRNKYVRKKKK